MSNHPAMTSVICPKCGAENQGDAMNCIACRVNLAFALEHRDEMKFAQEHPDRFERRGANQRRQFAAIGTQVSGRRWIPVVLILTTILGNIAVPLAFAIRESLWDKVFS